jgi:5'-3' exonuclease
MPVNAVRGLLDFIATLVDTYHPTHLACCWDNDWRPAWRVELIPSYKAHRVAEGGATVVAEMASSASTAGETAPDGLAVQVPVILDVLRALGLAVVGKDGYEADDVIGTLASISPMPTDVVTGDRDLFQLVDDSRQIRVLYIARGVGKHEQVDDSWMQARYKIPAAAYVDYATLRGDASDGLPGVAGIGEKTAATLLASYGHLEAILAAASDPRGPLSNSIRSKLGAAIDYLAVAPTVVSVVRDLDLGIVWDDLRIPAGPRDPEQFAQLADRYGLSGSARRIVTSLTTAG